LWLALVPVGVAFVLGILLAPHRADPEGVPLPLADAVLLARTAAADHALAEKARQTPLPGAVRALGSAVRAFHTLEAHDADAHELYGARRAVDDALVDALRGASEPLLELRALQLEGFLEEVHRFESTGTQSEELAALAGAFVRSMTLEGWVQGRRVVADDAALRALFKNMWNGFLGPEVRAEFAPTLDEQRALYAFYLSHAHPSRSMRDAIEAARRGARDAKDCDALTQAERVAVAAWRLEHVERLRAIDPSYPADYARGVASYARGDYAGSAKAFRAWLVNHPDGPLALRATNYLRAAVSAESVE
jgi:TolA-binding protein